MADIVYDIQFTVDRATPKVTPTAPQKAGYYGDENAARLTFSGVDDSFGYQIEIVDGNGAYDITETLTTDGAGNLVYEVPSAWTAAGLASVRLVELGEESVMHYPEVQLLFEARETGEQMGDMLPRWQSVMRDSEAATQDAIEAAEYATQAGEFAASQTPNIQNGEWYLGDQNTGVQATGPKGETGERGPQGPKGDNGVVDYTKAANALKGKVEGNIVAIKDASPFKQVVPIKGNMLPDIEEKEKNGVTIFRTGDGGFAINGKVEEPFSDTYGFVLDAGDYTFCANNESTTNGLQLNVVSSEAGVMEYVNFSRANERVSFSVGSRANFTLYLNFPNDDFSFKNFKFNPILAKDDGEATVTKYGKNLFDLSKAYNFIRCTYNAEAGEIKSDIVNSTYCTIRTKGLNDIFLASKGKSFTGSISKGHDFADRGLMLKLFGTRTDGTGSIEAEAVGSQVTLTIDDKFTSIDYLQFLFNRGKSATDQESVFADFQIEFGDTATEYEPYVEPTTLTGNSITMKGEGVTLFANNGETLTAEYSRDINKAFAELWKKVMEG